MNIVVGLIAAAAAFLIIVGLFYRFRPRVMDEAVYADSSVWPDALSDVVEPRAGDDPGPIPTGRVR